MLSPAGEKGPSEIVWRTMLGIRQDGGQPQGSTMSLMDTPRVKLERDQLLHLSGLSPVSQETLIPGNTVGSHHMEGLLVEPLRAAIPGGEGRGAGLFLRGDGLSPCLAFIESASAPESDPCSWSTASFKQCVILK